MLPAYDQDLGLLRYHVCRRWKEAVLMALPLGKRQLTLVAVLLCSLLLWGQRKYPTNFGSSEPPAQTTSPQTQESVPASTTTKAAEIAAPSASSVTPTSRKLSYDMQVGGSQQWTDTGIDLLAGDQVTITSEGTIDYGIQHAAPAGLPRTWREVISSLPVNSAGVGALIGRLGPAGVEMPFLAGAQKQLTITHAGRLFLGINQAASSSGTGAYNVKVQIAPGQASAAKAVGAAVSLPSDLFSRIPRRIEDKDGNPGDMVNFLIIGTQEKMQQTFADAGWVLVDRTKAGAALHAILSTYSKQVYTEMPMSELYLFGRAQDFGYAHAEPVQVVQTRHHLRIWKADFDIEGQPVWVGAATHDIGFERDNRSQKATAITHKIDPDIDKERQFVEESLGATGDLAVVSKVTPPDPLREAKTATGGSFHSDGQVLVMKVK